MFMPGIFNSSLCKMVYMCSNLVQLAFGSRDLPQAEKRKTVRVVHKVCLQDKVGRWSKNVRFLSTFITVGI